MSAFAAALAGMSNLPKGPPCSVKATLDNMDPDSRADMEGALGAASISSSAISRALAAVGNRVSAQTLSRHRRGVCSCGVE